MDWARLVLERNEWVSHNFPHKEGDLEPPGQSIFGCIEELGELVHHRLKLEQHIRGTDEEHIEGEKDSIGDLSVYLLGVMNVVGIPVSRPIMTIPSLENTIKILAKSVGDLALRGWLYDVEKTVAAMIIYCEHMDWDYEEIVCKTWEEVKKRDWIAYPDTGFPPEANAAEMTNPPLVDSTFPGDIMQCEEHPGVIWPHGDCPGPGMPLATDPSRATWLEDLHA